MWAFFFFSSRRRHTRFKCDWSSDVCSSDLPSRIGIVKAQRFRDAQTVACETGAYLVSRRVGRVKQHFAERARVLGANVNRARPRGSSDNLRSAEVCAVDTVAAGAARHCRKRLAEDPGLRTSFRTYTHALARLHLPRGERGQKDCDSAK